MIMKRKNLSFIGYPYYDVCSNGDIISLSYRRSGEENKLKPHKTTKGYYQVRLRNNGSKKLFSVHRLVAMAFIPNPLKLPQINHKDENKTNNDISNLEWCSNKYNMNYGTGNIRRSASCKSKSKAYLEKRVEQLGIKGNHIAFYKSLAEARRITGAKNISHVCNNKIKTSGGFIWRFA